MTRPRWAAEDFRFWQFRFSWDFILGGRMSDSPLLDERCRLFQMMASTGMGFLFWAAISIFYTFLFMVANLWDSQAWEGDW
jgi:hypothetical protein